MKRINIEIPLEIHTQIKVKASEKGQTMKEYIINLLKKEVQSNEAKLKNKTIKQNHQSIGRRHSR